MQFVGLINIHKAFASSQIQFSHQILKLQKLHNSGSFASLTLEEIVALAKLDKAGDLIVLNEMWLAG